MLADLDGKLLADTLHADRRNTPFPFPALVAAARHDGKARAIVLIDGMPYQIVVVPVLAPVPIAWVAMGFVMDDRLIKVVRRTEEPADPEALISLLVLGPFVTLFGAGYFSGFGAVASVFCGGCTKAMM